MSSQDDRLIKKGWLGLHNSQNHPTNNDEETPHGHVDHFLLRLVFAEEEDTPEGGNDNSHLGH